MRPVDKPRSNKVYYPYGTAKRDLANAIGRYCSYCERYLGETIAIEHVQPKSLQPNKATLWDNFLLSCTNCNSHKSARDINDGNINTYAWPDKDDTYHLINYDETTAMPFPAADISDIESRKVKNLISLVGLDVVAPKIGSVSYESMSDMRAEDRLKFLKEAKEYKTEYLASSDRGKRKHLDFLRKYILLAGYWSIWMHVFEDVPEVKEMLLEIIPGTKKSYF